MSIETGLRAGMTDSTESSRRSPWAYWGPMLLIWVGAVALRLVLLRGERVVWGDEPFYLWLGRNWITGQGFEFVGHADVHHGPLFPMVVGLVSLLIPNLAVASEIIYVIAGSGLVFPVYGIGHELHGRRIGFIAAAIAAVFPALGASVLHWGTLTEPLYMVLVYVGLWAGLLIMRPIWGRGKTAGNKAEHPDPWWSPGLTGICFGLAYLTRPEAINYFLVVGAFYVALSVLRGYFRKRRFWLTLLFYATAFALAFVPYAYYVKLHTGAWMVSEKIGVAYLTGVGLARGDTAAFDRSTWGLDSSGLEVFFFSSESYNVSMLSLILQDPKTFLSVLFLNLQSFARILVDWTLFPYPLVPVVFLGLFYRGWSRERTLKELYLLLSMLPVMSFILFFIQARYLVAIVPVLIVWVSLGLAQMGDWLMGTVVALRTPESVPGAEGRAYWHMPEGWRAALQALPVLVLVIALVAAQPRVVQKVTSVGSVRPEHRLLGEVLAHSASPDTVIMSRYPAIAFHANALWVPTPNASLPDVMAYAHHKGADYFVIDERELRYRPQFRDLLSGDAVMSALEPVSLDPAISEGLVVYRVLE